VSAVRTTAKLFLWLFIGTLLSSIAAAGNFSVSFSPASQSIAENEIARYNVTIFQSYPGVEFFEIYSPEVLWDIRTKDPLHVAPGSPFGTTLLIQPLNINPGLYGVPIHIKRTGTNDVRKVLLYMEVTGVPSIKSYLPAVRGTVELPQSIDPREEITITLNLENQNRRNLTDLKVKMRSNVINQDYITSLGPLERKTARFTARIDPRTSPQRDLLKVAIIATELGKGYEFDLPPAEYAVHSYGHIQPVIEDHKSFLKNARIITVNNNANILLHEPYNFPLPWFARLFTSAEPEEARVENGGLVWDIVLNVGEAKELRVTTNYRPLAVAIALAIVVLVLYYVFRSPLAIRKSAAVVSTREGGISELKILLELRNRSGKPVRHATIIDLVPRIAELEKTFDVGTLTPTKVVRNERKGTLIRYEVGDVMPYEERVISYKVKSTLSILGGVSLPVAVAKFLAPNGKERTTSSNPAKIAFFG
jgi:hypothetical protein